MNKMPRLLSVDYFRGIAVLLMLVYDYAVFFSAAVPLVFQHGRLDMLLFGDFIAPFFLFIMGFSLPLAVTKQREAGLSEAAIFWRVMRRAFLLLAIGVFIDDLRAPLLGGAIGLGGTYYIKWGVLEALGVSYLITYLVMRLGTKTRYLIAAVMLGAYWALLSNSWVQSFVLSHAHGSPIAAISWAAIAVFGMIAGDRRTRDSGQFEQYLYRLGGTLVIIGTIVGLFVPALKDLVSPSYALITAGGSAIAFMVVYYLVETRASKWAITILKPMREFGRAAMLAWILQYAIPGYLIWYLHTYGRLDPWLGMPLAFLMTGVVWLAVWALNRFGIRLAV